MSPPWGGSGSRAATDWVFWGFVVLASFAFGYKGVAKARIRAAEDRASLCLAQRDAACATTSIEGARVFASTGEPRLDVASAGLAVLTGHLDQAAQGANQAKAIPDLDAVTRGELLLVQGDLAEARGDYKGARDDWTAARPLVTDDSLVTTRLSREERSEEDRATSLSSDLSAMSTAFDDLFALAVTATVDRVAIRAGDLRDRIRHLPESDGRSKLLRAVDVAVQACSAAARKRAIFAYDPYRSSVPPTAPPDPSPAALHDYKARLAQYEALRKASDDRRTQGEGDAVAAARSILEEGSRLVHDGLAALAPASSATEGAAK